MAQIERYFLKGTVIYERIPNDRMKGTKFFKGGYDEVKTKLIADDSYMGKVIIQSLNYAYGWIEYDDPKNENKMIKLTNLISEMTSYDMSKSDWKEFFEMGKRTDMTDFKTFEKKYGNLVDLPHISDAMSKTKAGEFDKFYRMIKPFVTEFKKMNEFISTKKDIQNNIGAEVQIQLGGKRMKVVVSDVEGDTVYLMSKDGKGGKVPVSKFLTMVESKKK